MNMKPFGRRAIAPILTKTTDNVRIVKMKIAAAIGPPFVASPEWQNMMAGKGSTKAATNVRLWL